MIIVKKLVTVSSVFLIALAFYSGKFAYAKTITSGTQYIVKTTQVKSTFKKSQSFNVIDKVTGNIMGLVKISGTFSSTGSQVSVVTASGSASIIPYECEYFTLSKPYYNLNYGNIAEVSYDINWICPKTDALCSAKIYLYCTPSGNSYYKVVSSDILN